MESCVSYLPSTYEYIFPSPIIFQTFCISHDRTDLFIVSFIRLVLWVLLYIVVRELVDPDKIDENIWTGIRYMFYIIIGINILYLGMVVLQKQIVLFGSELNDTIMTISDSDQE